MRYFNAMRAASKAAAPVRRMRSATYWDSVDAPNNPRAAYDTTADYEANARNNTTSLFDLSDPSHPASPKQIQPSYNPAGRGLLRAPNTR